MFRSWVEIKRVVALGLGPLESGWVCTADLAAGQRGGKGGAQSGWDLSLVQVTTCFKTAWQEWALRAV